MSEASKQTALIDTLSQFGLNPTEWTLHNSVKSKGAFRPVLLVNKKDPDFRLLGKSGKKGLQNLKLLSV